MKSELTPKQVSDFETNGFLVIRNVIPKDKLELMSKLIDNIQGRKGFNEHGRWDLRNCLPHSRIFADLLGDKTLVNSTVDILGYNIKLLGSHLVTLNSKSKESSLSVDWHRDGGILSLEMPDPLPPLFLKVAFCITGSTNAEGGELLVVPGSHRLVGEPAIDSTSNSPVGTSKVILTPGDMLIFDWRLWHAVSPNQSKIIRKTLYFAFGFRWLAPIDYKTMPDQLMSISPIHRQLLGGSSEMGNYLPTDEELPLKIMVESRSTTERGENHNGI